MFASFETYVDGARTNLLSEPLFKASELVPYDLDEWLHPAVRIDDEAYVDRSRHEWVGRSDVGQRTRCDGRGRDGRGGNKREHARGVVAVLTERHEHDGPVPRDHSLSGNGPLSRLALVRAPLELVAGVRPCCVVVTVGWWVVS